MKKLMILIISLLIVLAGCQGEDDERIDPDSTNQKKCKSSADCPVGQECNPETQKCEGAGSLPGDSENNNGENPDGTEDPGNGNNSGETGGGGYSGKGECPPGETEKCNYQGPPETEDIGACKAAERTCQDDYTWGPCVGEVLPELEVDELCFDGIDNDCDGTVDNGVDYDGDGHPSCQDCCEFVKDCPDPKDAWDAAIHFCSYDEEDNAQIYDCDSDLMPSNAANPMDYAKAIGLCKTATEDPSSGWGVISAEILKADGTFGAHGDSNGILSALGNAITPRAGNYMLALSSGKVGNPFPCSSNKHCQQGVSSNPPSDWYAANGNKYPSSPACSGSTGTTGNANDCVMLQLRIRTPKTAKSFSFNLYFLSIEYPSWICSSYNDFFVALLDSTHTSDNPEFQNPFDKNLGRDAAGNPVGVNLAPAGLFKQCVNATNKGVDSCVGTEELAGTGFEGHGGTSWLVTRGNVVGGEVITLRLAIWDLGDHSWDSMVLIDNFKWEFEEYKPGTGVS